MSDVPAQICDLPLFVTTETCSGGTYIVTGANTGLGFEAAKRLIALGAAKVIMAVRDISLGEIAQAKIEAATHTTSVAEVWELDLASYASVKAFAKKAVAELDRIDALVENAAVAVAQRVLAEGHAISVTVNVLSTFLLAVLMLPKMSESTQKFGNQPHLVVVTSGVSFTNKEDWDKIKDDPLAKMDAEDMSPMVTYAIFDIIHLKKWPYTIRLELTSLPGIQCPSSWRSWRSFTLQL
jgi:hypothetical protein